MNSAAIWVLGALYLAVYLAMPVLVPWGWVRRAKHRGPRTVPGILSLIGFTLASSSCLLAVCSVLFANAIGGFAFYDPLLMRIIGWGFKLSLAGLGFGITGIWRSNPLRWHAPACAAGMFVYWFGTAMAE